MQRRGIRPNDAKLVELILLISEWSQGDPKFGAIKLNKLLFHADFSAFLTTGEPITGQEYFALPQGPAPKRFKPITEKMKKGGALAYQEVSYFGHPQKPYALRTSRSFLARKSPSFAKPLRSSGSLTLRKSANNRICFWDGRRHACMKRFRTVRR